VSNPISVFLTRNKVKRKLWKLEKELVWLKGKELSIKLQQNEIFNLVDEILYEMWIEHSYSCYDKTPILNAIKLCDSIDFKLTEWIREIADNIINIIDNNNKLVNSPFFVNIWDEEKLKIYVEMLYDEEFSRRWFKNLVSWIIQNIRENIKSPYFYSFLDLIVKHKHFSKNDLTLMLTKWHITNYNFLLLKRYLIENLNISPYEHYNTKEIVEIYYNILLLDSTKIETTKNIIWNLKIEELELIYSKLKDRHFINSKEVLNILNSKIIFFKNILDLKR